MKREHCTGTDTQKPPSGHSRGHVSPSLHDSFPSYAFTLLQPLWPGSPWIWNISAVYFQIWEVQPSCSWVLWYVYSMYTVYKSIQYIYSMPTVYKTVLLVLSYTCGAFTNTAGKFSVTLHVGISPPKPLEPTCLRGNYFWICSTPPLGEEKTVEFPRVPWQRWSLTLGFLLMLHQQYWSHCDNPGLRSLLNGKPRAVLIALFKSSYILCLAERN